MTTGARQPQKGYRTLRLPLTEHEYDPFLSDNAFAQERLEQLYGQYPEWFPESFEQGDVLYGSTAWSSKLDIRCRRLRVGDDKVIYTVAPGLVMPYRSGHTDNVSKALFLMRFHVPCWAIAHVFGRDAMYWYRLEQSLGRFSVVGTTVKSAAALPADLVVYLDPAGNSTTPKPGTMLPYHIHVRGHCHDFTPRLLPARHPGLPVALYHVALRLAQPIHPITPEASRTRAPPG